MTYSGQIPLARRLPVLTEPLLSTALEALSPVIDIRPRDVFGAIRSKGKAVSLLLAPSPVVELWFAYFSLAAVNVYPVPGRRGPELGPDVVLAVVSFPSEQLQPTSSRRIAPPTRVPSRRRRTAARTRRTSPPGS